jgi:lipid A 3-O-deacylase
MHLKHIHLFCTLATFCGIAFLSGGASAQELFLGAAVQGVDTPFSLDANEHGTTVQFGLRGERESGLKKIGAPSLYVQGSVNVDGYTSWVSAGLSWRIGKGPVYFRPGVGLAYHDRNYARYKPIAGGRQRTDLGSSVLFEPEMVLGAKLVKNVATEFAWTHTSNARILSKQNPGVDYMGVRMVIKLK